MLDIKRKKIKRKLSEEHKRKIRESCKGKINLGNKHTLGHTPWNKGLKYSWSKETKLKHKGASYYFKKGENHLNWKGGISTLSELIRQLDEYKIWRNEVRKGYICEECSSKCLIEAHHKKPFKEILQEFLNKYNQFSLIEDKEILVRLSITYKDFWDVNNGKALCKECHDITKKYRKRDKKCRFL